MCHHISSAIRDISSVIFLHIRAVDDALWLGCTESEEKYKRTVHVTFVVQSHKNPLADFYHAMHFSAKRSIVIACRLSVCPSVCLSVCLSVTLVDCDHIGWNTSEIISPLVSSPGMFTLCNPNTPIFGPKVTHPPVDLSVGDIRSQIAAEWLQIAQWSQWRAYRNLPSLFLMVPSLTPYDLPFPQN